MGFLDAYDTFVNNKCQELSLQNGTFEKLTQSLGLSNITAGVQDLISKGVVESLTNSPLRVLAEDVLAQTITNNARRLSQNLLNQIPSKLTGTLTDIRSAVFKTVFTTLTLQNDLVLYFASVIAEQAVEAIKDKRRTLITLQENIRKLHNALLVLAGGGPFFNQYLASLRQALLALDRADDQLQIVQSAFFSQTIFPRANFNRANQLLEQAYNLIMPPVTGQSGEELKQGFLKGVFEQPEYGQQLAQLMTIPRLTKEMLGSYDLYAVKVLKVNALLLGFQSCVQNLKQVTGGQFKDLVLEQIQNSRDSLRAIIESMALQLNGDVGAIAGPIQAPVGNAGAVSLFKPSAAKTSARAIEWGIKVKALQVQLNVLDADALSNLSASSQGLREYDNALQRLAALDDRRTNLAVLRATDGREQPGDIEGSLITFAFQANQAIVDSSRLVGSPAQGSSRTVLALGAQLNARIQLSIDQDREIEMILLRYIQKTKPLIQNIRSLGDSIFKLLDTLGMDRASDFLKRGAFGEFFSMNARTATYVGAGVAGLSALRSLLSSQEQQQCIVESINKLQVEETSKKLSSQRTVANNFVKQQKQNEKICTSLKRDQAKTQGCAQGIGDTQLRDNPLRSLSGLFRGVFGGDTFDSLDSTFGNFREISAGGSGIGVGAFTGGIVPGSVQGVFSSVDSATIAAQDAAAAATTGESAATAEMRSVLAEAGVNTQDGESLDSLQNKLNYVRESTSNPDLLDKVNEASTSADLARYMKSDAYAAELNVKKIGSPFQKFVSR